MENPVPIRAALDALGDKRGAATIAAFLLLAGVWHKRGLTEQLVSHWQLETLGLTSWNRQAGADLGRIEAPPWLFSYGGIAPDPGTPVGPDAVNEALRDSIHAAMDSGTRIDAARAVEFASLHPDRLIRLCAQISALELFRLRGRHIERLWSELGEAGVRLSQPRGADEGPGLEQQLADILRQRLERHVAGQRPRPTPSSPQTRAPGLILIHGTTLWGCPDSSVPKSPLFEYIHRELRGDVYAREDYFRWEGSYTDYGREVAAASLREWVAQRGMEGVDAVCHSHGGNVLLKATEMGGVFGHVLLLSCPVRRTYKLRPGSAITARSLRVKLDLIILADRARQKFPPASGLHEEYLPVWFDHWATTHPENWRRFKIRV